MRSRGQPRLAGPMTGGPDVKCSGLLFMEPSCSNTWVEGFDLLIKGTPRLAEFHQLIVQNAGD
jgi:hypothetical protein